MSFLWSPKIRNRNFTPLYSIAIWIDVLREQPWAFKPTAAGPDISGSKKTTKDGGIATCALQFASVEKAHSKHKKPEFAEDEFWTELLFSKWEIHYLRNLYEFMRSMFYSWGGSFSKSKEAIVDKYLGLISSGGYTQKVIQLIAPKLVKPQLNRPVVYQLLDVAGETACLPD